MKTKNISISSLNVTNVYHQKFMWGNRELTMNITKLNLSNFPSIS